MNILICLASLLAVTVGQNYGSGKYQPFSSGFGGSPSHGGSFGAGKPSFYSSSYKSPSVESGLTSPFTQSAGYAGPKLFTPAQPAHYNSEGSYNSGPAHYNHESSYSYGGPGLSHYSSGFTGSSSHFGSDYSAPSNYESGPSHYESGPSHYESGPLYQSNYQYGPSASVKVIKNPKNYLSSPAYEKVVQVEDVPRIGHNGVPLDTPEVAALKAAHFEAHAKALSRHRRGTTYYGHGGNGHGHGHAYSTQNHNAYFGHPHVVHVSGGHGHYRRRRSAYHGGYVGGNGYGHGHAYSTQNHNAYFGHPHVVHVSGGGHHHLGKRDTYEGGNHPGGASSSQNSNVFHAESKPIRVQASGYAPGQGVPHETAEVTLAKQAHFRAHDQVLKSAGLYKPQGGGHRGGSPFGDDSSSYASSHEYY
ncbi:hornerin-like [Chrysoperla carnea]|uniref:hornerin-like n=1 Tax=Chrysoperla carnea TaxID=189513 RepID=UPI001D06DAD3|nr:hornerin-like [Chrysoperla carnea]